MSIQELRIAAIIIAVICIFSFSSCEYSLEITDISINNFPNKIIYVANIDDEIDLNGCTILIKTKDGEAREVSVIEDPHCKVEQNVDFSTPGIYKIKLSRSNQFEYIFPIQVIDKDFFLN